ncbi:MAG: 1-acyl-sn-glycerol-3-phosphate acyltransferase [Clostridia bacterium]|nr:1-acyl-sn-glycerol-3-phosphate acyltransferase [Clostridia bacterium]
MIIYLVKKILYLVLSKIYYNVKHISKENEENLDRCIICANHTSAVDSIYIYSVTKNLSIMAKSELFKYKIIGNIFKYFGIFPIRRGKKDASSLLHAINLFESGNKIKLLIFPEGTRVKSGEHLSPKVGPAYVAVKANVPIVPVYISNDRRPFSKIKIIYGKPVYLDRSRNKDKVYLQSFSDELLNKIYSLKDEI